jgi:hypothetical protein
MNKRTAEQAYIVICEVLAAVPAIVLPVLALWHWLAP